MAWAVFLGLRQHIQQYRNGKDLTQTARGVMVIDLFGLSADEVRSRYPEVYQWVVERVKPERDHNRPCDVPTITGGCSVNPARTSVPSLVGLSRYIATVETSKHRFFVFLDGEFLPDNMLTAIAVDDAYIFGVLSSRIHVAMGVGDWWSARCWQ